MAIEGTSRENQSAGIHFADAVSETTAQPPIGQVSLVGNGAHSVPFEPSSFAECAPVIVGSQAQTAQKPARFEPIRRASSGAAHSLASNAAAPATLEFTGTTILDLDQIVNRALAANRVIERIGELCPQGMDCAGDGQHRRIFACEEGCGFRGCAACMAAHETEPHWSDSATAREMSGST